LLRKTYLKFNWFSLKDTL